MLKVGLGAGSGRRGARRTGIASTVTVTSAIIASEVRAWASTQAPKGRPGGGASSGKKTEGEAEDHEEMDSKQRGFSTKQKQQSTEGGRSS